MSLYVMGTIGNRRALHVRMDEESDERVPDICKLVTGEWKPNTPLVYRYFKGASGSIACDFITTSCATPLLISNRVVEVLRSFRGWDVYPVEVYGKDGRPLPGYHGLQVIGRCGPIQKERARRRIVPPISEDGPPSLELVGLHFDPSTWDGSDIFYPQRTCIKVVTEPLMEAMKEARLSNIEFTPAEEYVVFHKVLINDDMQKEHDPIERVRGIFRAMRGGSREAPSDNDE